MRKQFAELSKQEISNNPNSYVLIGDVGAGAFIDKGDDLLKQVFNMGIAEQAMIGFAAGLSTGGGNIIVSTISPFLIERTFEQIKLCCGYNNAKMILVSANGPYDYDKLGPTHHCPSDVSILATIPNFNICVPATVDDMKECFTKALASSNSTYIRTTSRVAKVDDYVRVNHEWKKIPGNNNVVVCVGESLTYQLAQNSGSTVYWTSNPLAQIPEELLHYNSIVILEPYNVAQLQVPEVLHNSQIIKRCFSKEHKKIMQKNLGWEDFAV